MKKIQKKFLLRSGLVSTIIGFGILYGVKLISYDNNSKYEYDNNTEIMDGDNEEIYSDEYVYSSEESSENITTYPNYLNYLNKIVSQKSIENSKEVCYYKDSDLYVGFITINGESNVYILRSLNMISENDEVNYYSNHSIFFDIDNEFVIGFGESAAKEYETVISKNNNFKDTYYIDGSLDNGPSDILIYHLRDKLIDCEIELVNNEEGYIADSYLHCILDRLRDEYNVNNDSKNEVCNTLVDENNQTREVMLPITQNQNLISELDQKQKEINISVYNASSLFVVYYETDEGTKALILTKLDGYSYNKNFTYDNKNMTVYMDDIYYDTFHNVDRLFIVTANDYLYENMLPDDEYIYIYGKESDRQVYTLIEVLTDDELKCIADNAGIVSHSYLYQISNRLNSEIEKEKSEKPYSMRLKNN